MIPAWLEGGVETAAILDSEAPHHTRCSCRFVNRLLG